VANKRKGFFRNEAAVESTGFHVWERAESGSDIDGITVDYCAASAELIDRSQSLLIRSEKKGSESDLLKRALSICSYRKAALKFSGCPAAVPVRWLQSRVTPPRKLALGHLEQDVRSFEDATVFCFGVEVS